MCYLLNVVRGLRLVGLKVVRGSGTKECRGQGRWEGGGIKGGIKRSKELFADCIISRWNFKLKILHDKDINMYSLLHK